MYLCFHDISHFIVSHFTITCVGDIESLLTGGFGVRVISHEGAHRPGVLVVCWISTDYNPPAPATATVVVFVNQGTVILAAVGFALTGLLFLRPTHTPLMRASGDVWDLNRNRVMNVHYSVNLKQARKVRNCLHELRGSNIALRVR